MSDNMLEGPLPREVGKLAMLEQLGLAYNNLKGTVVKKPFFFKMSLFLPYLGYKLYLDDKRSSILSVGSVKSEPRIIRATLLEGSVLWAGRVCVFYALLQAGLAGYPSNPIVLELDAVGGPSRYGYASGLPQGTFREFHSELEGLDNTLDNESRKTILALKQQTVELSNEANEAKASQARDI
ncbi:putative rRNA-processing protein EBP2 -like protein [Capsicum annuum]|nr:putative rRNA-processing protein EBP2 -like protein [Capsicum annuum]